MPQPANRWSTRFAPTGPIAALCGVLLLTSGAKPPAKGNQSSRVNSTEPVATGEAQASDVAHLGVWIDAARETFKRVNDYQCTLSKRERVDGALQEEHTATMKCRTEPFSVHLKFTAPKAVAGKEASYVAGRHNGKMRAKSSGALSLVGYVTIDPHDTRAMQGTKHSVTEAGIANLIERLIQSRRAVQADGRKEPQVIVSEYSVAQRACVRFDITDPAADGGTHNHRTVVYFDKETNLPVRYESYDKTGEMVECFAYTDLHFNVGLTDAAFP
jgi:hypothetical protein